MKKYQILALGLLCVGVANAALTLSEVISGDLDPSWNSINLTTFDGTQASTAGTTTDWHFFGGSGVTPAETKLNGDGIGALTFTQGATGGTLFDKSGSTSQPNIGWSDGTTVTATTLDDRFLASDSDKSGTYFGEAFSLSLAAASEETTAYLILGAVRCEGTLTATLGAESENLSYDVSGGNGGVIYKLVYSSETETSLDLTWENTEDGNLTNNGGIRFQAVTMNVIPEPATFGLVVVFGGGILFVRRRFRR